MIEMTITNVPAGKAFLYERSGRQGKRIITNSFCVIANDTKTGDRFEFAVTRSSSRLVFDVFVDRYGTDGECPPSRPDQRYEARASQTSKGTFCLRLYEAELSEKKTTLRGQGDVDRTDIMIHGGPGMSEGCFLIAGGKKGHRRFERWFKARIDADTNIVVEVLPYS